MNTNELPKRNILRLEGFDYSTSGAYYVTMCTHQKQHLFGRIADGKMYLNALGKIANQEWLKLKDRFTKINIDVYQIMPNHIHAIVAIGIDDDIDLESDKTITNPKVTEIVCAFKSLVTRHYKQYCRENNIVPIPKLWQRSYYDHIIRNEDDLRAVADYIRFNPINWELDKYNRP